jgi:hypothetical protein
MRMHLRDTERDIRMAVTKMTQSHARR